MKPEKILLSRCLAGFACRYDGKSLNRNEKFTELYKQGAILACPEELGGLSTPRPPAEIRGGDGNSVIREEAKVININGEDVTDNYLSGAEQTLKLAKENSIELAVLKARSPACGLGVIYDGSFSGKFKKGDGVAAALLKKEGFKVMSDEEFNENREKISS
jgi:uncharacterized protein YbbK (DUF523 family)